MLKDANVTKGKSMDAALAAMGIALCVYDQVTLSIAI